MINSIVLQGRLTKDPELKYTNSGTAVVSFGLAVTRNFKNQQGDYEADFPMVQAWRKTAELIAEHFRKGDEILIQGRLQTRTYDNQQGQKVYVTEIVADSFAFTSGRKQQNNQGMDNHAQQQNPNYNQQPAPQNNYDQQGMNNQGPQPNTNYNQQAQQGQYQQTQPNNQYQPQGVNQGPFGTISDSDLPF